MWYGDPLANSRGLELLSLHQNAFDARAVNAARRLQAEGFDIRAIRPPTVAEGTARLRVSIHADHNHNALQQLAAALAPMVQEASCVPAPTGRNNIAQGNALGSEGFSRDKP